MLLGGTQMNNFETRVYSINDFLEWDVRGELEISPKFQRRPVWSPQAKSYLIDTILRGIPLPKIFIRAKTNPRTRKTVREIVDGQQRIRTILSFINDGFRISKVHNEEYGGMTYSELPENVQSDFLKYRLSVDLLQDLEDQKVLEIFARLNTYSVSLNKQELYNSKYFGYFKQLVYSLGGEYLTFWVESGILTDRKIARMAEAELVADLLIAALDGFQSRKNAEKYYKKYDNSFESRLVIRSNFCTVMDLIGNLLGDTLRETSFKTSPNFYGLFVALYHMNYGIPGLEAPRKPVEKKDYAKIRNCLEDINSIIESEDVPKEYAEFVKSAKDATTDVPARTTRCKFIAEKLYQSMREA